MVENIQSYINKLKYCTLHQIRKEKMSCKSNNYKTINLLMYLKTVFKIICDIILK